MSTLKAGTVQTDTVAAKDGQGIPNNLRSLTPFCYGVIQTGQLKDSINVSSIVLNETGIKVKMINPAQSVNYAVVATRNGEPNEFGAFRVTYYASDSGDANAKTQDNFTLLPEYDTYVATDASEISFLVFDKGQTV